MRRALLRAIWTAALLATALALPAAALACPYCAGNSRGGGAWYAVVAAMILLPFAVVGVLVPFFKKVSRPPS